MVETTKTAEALETAVSGTGVMQSEYFKLKYNPETGRWEKEKVTEDITPVFPGIRDVTPEYTPEGKTFKTIPIGAGPDYTPVPPVVTPTPTPPVEPPVETPTEPVTPIVTEPETRGTDVAQEQIEREQVFKPKNTFVDTDGVTKKSITPQANYRIKYQSMPGGLNNMSDAQVLQYAIETGALNQMLSQENNPYFVTEPEKKEGMMAKFGATTSLPIKAGAAMLDATLGKMSRKALVKRLVDANILFGDVNNYIDDEGNFKSSDVGRLVKLFKDESTPMNGLISEADAQKVTQIQTQREPFNVTVGSQNVGTADDIRSKTFEEYYQLDTGLNFVAEEQRKLQDRINQIDSRLQTIISESGFPGNIPPDQQQQITILGAEKKGLEDEYNRLNEQIGKGIYNDKQVVFDPRDQNTKILTPKLRKELQIFKTTQATAIEGAQTMSRVGIRGVGDIPNFQLATGSFVDGLKQAKIKRTTINGINYQFVDAGISEAQPVMGLSGDHTNGEKVYLDSNAGFYNSQGQYVADDNGDGIADKVRGGSASEAAEAANAGFIPQKLLDRMTNPDGSLKNLYDPNAKDFVGSKYKLKEFDDNGNKILEIRDGKAYYVGNVVKENRDVVDNGGNGNTVDNVAPSGSNDNNNYERDKQRERERQEAKKKEKEFQAQAGSSEEADKGVDRAGQASSSSSNQNSSADKKSKSIVCTEMYRQTQLDDWQRTIKLWYLFQKKYLSETHQKGYHFLFKPFVKGMQKSNMLTSIGRHFAQERTKDIKHIMYGTKFSLLGRVYRIILEPICFVVGLLLWQKK
tara:strand:+ start:2121 stop:4523 length:2403 start_codon:yes stop_codon:yes gene_type:complete